MHRFVAWRLKALVFDFQPDCGIQMARNCIASGSKVDQRKKVAELMEVFGRVNRQIGATPYGCFDWVAASNSVAIVVRPAAKRSLYRSAGI